jgi:hypothetical protein
VWPWLAQTGPDPRGGAYTYDWIENLHGLYMRRTDRVLPVFQDPEFGETIRLGANQMRLERVELERVLAWRSQDGNWRPTRPRQRGGIPQCGCGLLPMPPDRADVSLAWYAPTHPFVAHA